MINTAFPTTNPLSPQCSFAQPQLSLRPTSSGGDGSSNGARRDALRNRASAGTLETPDLHTVRKAVRRRFIDRFRKRRARNAAPGSPASQQRIAASAHPRRKRRKRTAMALGVSAMGLTGASNLALSSDPIHAEGMFFGMPDTQSAYALADPSERRNAAQLKVSDNLIDAMVEEEGVRYDVYRDVAGHPTVGVGHLVSPGDNLLLGDTISHDRAMALLEQDLAKAEIGVRELVGDLPVSQNEFDALVDLVFNVGIGNVSADKSPLLNQAIQQADYTAMGEELEYTAARNKVAKGLVYRSERRAQIFLSADYSDPRGGQA